MTDVAVVGLGAMGSMALWRLAERGVRAVGIDRFDPPHDRGASHGESRLIRTAYAEGAWYIPLAREAWRLWRELEALGGAELLTQTGALMVGPREGELLSGTMASAREHELEHEMLDAAAASTRWPQHVLTGDDRVLFDPAAGVLRPEACITAALARARALGATTRTSTRVEAIENDGDSTLLRLDDGDALRTRRCIVAAGPWTGMVLPELAAHLRVERQLTAWFEVDDPRAFAPSRFPVFVRELADGWLRYGVPAIDGRTIKIAAHHEGALADPDALERTVSPSDLAPLDEYATTMLRGVRTPPVRCVVCMYTNTPDEHLLVGPLPTRPGVVVAGGCSGHSFKFASVLGDVAADLVMRDATKRDIRALAVVRLVPGRVS